MTTKSRPIAPPPGYLYPMPPGSYADRERPILLKVACPCGKWHTHGAGTVERPADYRPGTVTHRASHCPTVDYRQIIVQAAPFRAPWETPRGRISATYPRHADRVAERVGSV